MNFQARFLTAMSCVAVSASALAIAGDNPYKVIFERNAFKLNPPVAVKPVEPPPEAPPPNVELTGFSQVGDEKKAWFMILPTKPGPNEQPQYVSLRAGERTAINGGSIELKELNDGREEVKVLISGKEATYSMKHASRTTPGMQPLPGGAVPPPPSYIPNGASRPVTPFAPTPHASTGSAGVISGTSSSVVAGQGGVINGVGVRSVAVPQATTATPQLNSLTVQSSDGTVRVPTRTLRLQPATQNGVIATPPPKPMTAEESIIAVEVNRELTKDAVARKELPPLPPTPLTDGSK